MREEDERENRERVFVYGTLRIGASNHHRLKGAEFIRRGVARGTLHQVSWYPGFVPDPEGGEVVGEVYLVDAGLLARLDEFEGLPPGKLIGGEYERRKIRVMRDPHATVWDDLPDELEAWAWVWHGETADLAEVATGDWLDVERPRQPSWFTGLGCLGLLAIPFGGVVLAEVASLRFARLREWNEWLAGGLFLAAGALAFGCFLRAHRRREKGMPLQILMAAGMALWVFVALCLLFG